LILYEQFITHTLERDRFEAAVDQGEPGESFCSSHYWLEPRYAQRWIWRVQEFTGSERQSYLLSLRAIARAKRKGRLICGQLAAGGFLEPSPRSPGEWLLTDKGLSLRAKKLLRRIDRDRAEAILAKAVEAARAFNADPAPNWRITQMYLFGSLATTAPTVGDVDVMVMVEPRYPWDEAFHERERKRLAILRPSHRSIIHSTRHEAFRRISKRSPYLSIADGNQLIKQRREGEPFRLVYELESAPA